MMENGGISAGGSYQAECAPGFTTKSSIFPLIEEVLSDMPDKVSEYRKGKKGLMGLFVGEIIKRSKGKADLKVVNELLAEKTEISDQTVLRSPCKELRSSPVFPANAGAAVFVVKGNITGLPSEGESIGSLFNVCQL